MDNQPSKMNPQDFENYQRILSSYPATSLTVTGLFLTFSASAFGGIFAIAVSDLGLEQKWSWLLALGLLILFITIALFIIWYREHKLKDQAVEDLKSVGIKFPETKRWTGLTTNMLMTLFLFATICWLMFITVAVVKAEILLRSYGL